MDFDLKSPGMGFEIQTMKRYDSMMTIPETGNRQVFPVYKKAAPRTDAGSLEA